MKKIFIAVLSNSPSCVVSFMTFIVLSITNENSKLEYNTVFTNFLSKTFLKCREIKTEEINKG